VGALMVKSLLTISGCVDGKEFTDHKWACFRSCAMFRASS